MTFRINLLSAAALLALPVVAGAQAQTPPPGTTMQDVNQTVQQAQDRNRANPPAGEQVQDEQPRQADQTPPQPAQQPPVNQDDAPPAPSATQTPPPAGTQSQTQPPPAEAPPPAQSQSQTSSPAQAQAQAGATTRATAADVTAGATVRDTAGAQVGTIESVDADSAIISTGTVRADIPITSFGKNNQGLVLAMTRAQLEAAARAAMRTPTS